MTLLCPERTAPSCRAWGGPTVLGGSLGCHGLCRCWTRGPAYPRQSCGPSSLLAPSQAGRAAPAPAQHAAPQRGCGATRPHSADSRKSSKTSHGSFEDPSAGFWLQSPPHCWEDSSWLNLRFNRALVLHMRAGSLGHHRPVWRSLRGRVWGPSTQASPGHVLGPLTQEGSKTYLPEGTARPSLGPHEGRGAGGCFRGPRKSSLARWQGAWGSPSRQ